MSDDQGGDADVIAFYAQGDANEFGRLLRRLREDAGLSQSQLAKQVGVDRSHISKIESGVIQTPSWDLRGSLFAVLGTSEEEFSDRMRRERSNPVQKPPSSAEDRNLLRGSYQRRRVTSALTDGAGRYINVTFEDEVPAIQAAYSVLQYISEIDKGEDSRRRATLAYMLMTLQDPELATAEDLIRYLFRRAGRRNVELLEEQGEEPDEDEPQPSE